jgi:DNA-binding XRE family transcriptional regulator
MALNLREIREARGFTQAKLALESGISRQTIISLESNPDYNVTSKTLVALADALSVEVQDLFLPIVSSEFHRMEKEA